MTRVFDLERFVTAQDAGGMYDAALGELCAGRKRTHWMWFVFPQVVGLGRSAMARRYALPGRVEASAYLAHPVLGPRLCDCCLALLSVQECSAGEVLGDIDAAKLRSSMTLFLRAEPSEPLFGRVLSRYFGGVPDWRTDEFLTD